MKKLNAYLLVALLGLAVFACDKEDEQITDPVETDLAATEAEIAVLFEEIDEVTYEMMDYSGDLIIEAENGRINHSDEKITSCASRTIDTLADESIQVTWTFDGSCTGKDGKVRSGMIVTNFTGRRFMPGSVITTSLQDYTVNEIQLEGTRIVENISASLLVSPAHKITLNDGKITWPDGRQATRTAERFRTWIRSGSPLNDQVQIEGQMAGVNKNGQAYQITITEPLIFLRACRVAPKRVFMPSSGQKLIQRNGYPDILVDYGQGECDKTFTVTMDGKVKTVN
ncbi:MAG: hypothetical protein ACNS62_15745 [Candidatus Cyclobacteriaceae bacterium M3_2C_046]